MVKKILGGILLGVGILAIGWGVFDSYLIFTAKKQAPQIFKAPVLTQQPVSGSPEAMAQQMVQEQLGKLLPAGSITELLNLISWSIFIGLLFLAGSKVAGIGVKLLQGQGRDNQQCKT